MRLTEIVPLSNNGIIFASKILQVQSTGKQALLIVGESQTFVTEDSSSREQMPIYIYVHT